MKRSTKTILIIIIAFLVIGILYFGIKISNKNNRVYTITNESLKFASEYENLNDEKINKDEKYLNIDIKSFNTIKYSNYEEIFETINKGTGIIFLGDPKCNWSRAMAPVLVDFALEEDIDEILYLNISEDRNELKLNKKGKIKTTKEGTEDYLKLVELLKDYLPAYDGLNDKSIKRIYLPTVIFVRKGKIVSLVQTLESYANRVDNKPVTDMTDTEKDSLKEILKKQYKNIR